jgi:hypothetical protein
MRVGKYIPLYVFIKQIKAYGRYFKAKQCLKIIPYFVLTLLEIAMDKILRFIRVIVPLKYIEKSHTK